MKKKLLTLFLISVTLQLSAQDLNVELEFKTKEDYQKHENEIKKIADYLLRVPVTDDRAMTRAAGATLLKWMSGTPDYKFEVDETVTGFSKGNENVLIPILASMASYVLHNPEKKSDKKEIKLQSYILFLDYCDRKENGVRQTRQIKKAIEAKNKGELRKFLSI